MRKTYAYHKPSPEATAAIASIREAFSKLHDEVENRCPASRERSLAMTELETAAMWAIKSVVSNDPGSTVEVS